MTEISLTRQQQMVSNKIIKQTERPVQNVQLCGVTLILFSGKQNQTTI